jgi:hypothetical protein
VHGGDLPGELVRVAAQRRQQHVGHEPDPRGHRGRGGQRGERLVAVVGEAVEDGEAGKPPPLRAPGERPPGDSVRVSGTHRLRWF